MPSPLLLPLKHDNIAGVDAVVAGTDGPPLVLIGGPPIGNLMFREVQRRLAPQATLAPDLFTAPAPMGVDAVAERLSEVVAAAGAQVVVAHGLGIPVALRARGFDRLILSNGPLVRLDPATRALAALPAAILHAVLQPRVLRRWLVSSIGLRRAVVNPYVMDRDTVAMLSEAFLGDRARRRATAAWLKSLPDALPSGLDRADKVDAIWGDWDFIYPISQAEEGEAQGLVDSVLRIAGGRWLHPEERPWALADALVEVLQTRKDPHSQATVTSMS